MNTYRAWFRTTVPASLTLLLLACGGPSSTPTQDAGQSADALAGLAAGDHRTPSYRQRDAYRHPVETLLFFGLRPDMHVVEIWPTAGWYTEIIAPFVAQQGQYYGAHFDAEHRSAFLRDQRASFEFKLASAPEIYGPAIVSEFGKGKYALAPAGSVDMVLTFRNVHNWVMGEYADDAFSAMYTALKPGGVMGVVEHRGATYLPGQTRPTGYVPEDEVVALAAKAGFVLEASAEINANPLDTKDYGAGVWSLPPSLRGGPVDYDTYMAIGESDRMTLKFRKP